MRCQADRLEQRGCNQWVRARARFRRARHLCLALADLVNLEDLRGVAGIERDVGQHGHLHQPLTVRLELLPRVPNFADTQVPFRSEANVVLEAVRKRLDSSLPKQPVGFVVLLGCQGWGL